MGKTDLFEKCNALEEFVVKLEIEEKDSCLIYVKSGKLFLDEMIFSCKYIS